MSLSFDFSSWKDLRLSSFPTNLQLLTFYLYQKEAWGSGISNIALMAIILASSLVAFLFIFTAMTCTAGESEVRLGRRMIYLAQVSLFLLVCRHLIQIYFDFESVRRIPPPNNELSLVWPGFPVLRPFIGLLINSLGLLLNTHHVFRWIVIIIQPLLCALELIYSCELDLQITCLGFRSCTEQATGYLSLYELNWVFRLTHVGAALSVFSVMSTCAVNSVMGPFGPRLPVRLFDVSQSLEAITHKASGEELEKKKNEKKKWDALKLRIKAKDKATLQREAKALLSGVDKTKKTDQVSVASKVSNSLSNAFKAVQQSTDPTTVITTLFQR
jgi:hypothetical protein